MAEEQMIFIGKKPTNNYVLAVVTEFNNEEIKGDKVVVIKARGRLTAKAIDVAEIVRNRFVKGPVIEKMETHTETLSSKDGRDVQVSSLEITMRKVSGL